MRFIFVATCVLSLSLVGCKSSCRQLSEALCDCAANSNDKNNCLQLAASKEGLTTISAEDDARCAALLPSAKNPEGCDCRLIDTAAGKKRCGLSL
jgi:hypothetical protein